MSGIVVDAANALIQAGLARERVDVRFGEEVIHRTCFVTRDRSVAVMIRIYKDADYDISLAERRKDATYDPVWSTKRIGDLLSRLGGI